MKPGTDDSSSLKEEGDSECMKSSLDEQNSDIFQGICIDVSGQTTPPPSDLQEIVLSHGGNYEQYYSNEKVPHTIATVLPTAKLGETNMIVEPELTTESIAMGLVLPAENYRLYNNDVSQSTVSADP